MRGARRNMSWMELGSRIMKLDSLHEAIRNVARGATRRGLKWYAYRMIEVNKYGGRQPYGQFIWIPKANLIGHLSVAPPGSGGFLGRDKPFYHSVHWERPHPLARNIKEVWDVHNWGTYRKGRIRRYSSEVPSLSPSQSPEFAHWLEAREVAEREGRKIAPFREWQKEKSDAFHEAWLGQHLTVTGRAESFRRHPRLNPGAAKLRFKHLAVGDTFIFGSERDPRFLTSGMAKGPWIKRGAREYEHVDDVGKAPEKKRYGAFRIIVGSINADVIRVQPPARNRGWRVRRSARRNPGRITIQFYRDTNGVIRRWGTAQKASLPDRHVLLVDYKHGGIFDTWKQSGERNFELVKLLK